MGHRLDERRLDVVSVPGHLSAALGTSQPSQQGSGDALGCRLERAAAVDHGDRSTPRRSSTGVPGARQDTEPAQDDLTRGGAGLGAGGHGGGQTVVRGAVEVGTRLVVAHRGARVGVAGGDLGVAQIDVSIVVTNVCRRMSGCMRADLHPSRGLQALQSAGAAW